MCLRAGSASAERVGSGEGGWWCHPQGDMHMVAVVEMPWLALGGSILA